MGLTCMDSPAEATVTVYSLYLRGSCIDTHGWDSSPQLLPAMRLLPRSFDYPQDYWSTLILQQSAGWGFSPLCFLLLFPLLFSFPFMCVCVCCAWFFFFFLPMSPLGLFPALDPVCYLEEGRSYSSYWLCISAIWDWLSLDSSKLNWL